MAPSPLVLDLYRYSSLVLRHGQAIVHTKLDNASVLVVANRSAEILICSSIDYAFWPRLRCRLTLSRFALPRNPWIFGGKGFYLSSRYLFRHSPFRTLHRASRHDFSANGMLPYHCNKLQSTSSVYHLSLDKFSARRLLTSELLRFL